MTSIDQTLQELEQLIRDVSFRELETDTLEIKPTPPTGGDWRSRRESVCAFLNSRGGILLLGVKEEGTGAGRRYVLGGYTADAEPQVKALCKAFRDADDDQMELEDCFPEPEIRPFMDSRIALVYVDELPADRKYAFLDGTAYKRVLTADQKITVAEVGAQEEYKRESWHVRELQPVPGATLDDLDLDKLNQYILLLNRTARIETLKPSMEAARPFLHRKHFITDAGVTALGALVCGRYPGDLLGFRAHLHGYVDMPGAIAQDKQDLVDNVLGLMEQGLAYVLRNIRVGVRASQAGTAEPQYPEELLRETINNALAHRDYSIDQQCIVAIRPGEEILVQNPGRFRDSLLISLEGPARVRRVLPEPKARNPKLADVLRVYRKWEGRGIGMATLTNLCLENRIDLPTYRLRQDDVTLHLRPGPLLTDDVRLVLSSMDRYLADRLGGDPTVEQQLVLAYLMKSQAANELERHTILLTADNNHYAALRTLEKAALVTVHPESPPLTPIYLADPQLCRRDYSPELGALFGGACAMLSGPYRQCLDALYRHETYSRAGSLSAKQASFYLWALDGRATNDIRAFDEFYRKIRYTFNKLLAAGLIVKAAGARGYVLNRAHACEQLL
ncbi:MAG: putative DNA binding domain-containing protein [Armatimonadetes bacterium]|nr:putative DNA binding domain-containing protein [Armatimonadota bacterium]